MDCNSITPELTSTQFARISRLAYRESGISLQPGKEALVRSRLTSRLLKLGLGSFDQYADLLEGKDSDAELRSMIDALATNKTSFFREPQHFAYLKSHVLPRLVAGGNPLRFWSAGCSSGEEPYTLAIVLLEEICAPHFLDCRILATDISGRVLEQARRGVYQSSEIESVPPKCLARYFTAAGDEASPAHRITEAVRRLIRFARLNLIDDWPMRGPFDVIFCRNVMIYFDQPTRMELAIRFTQLLAPGGHLFVGHTETLSRMCPELRYVQPAVYVKQAGRDFPED